ncbi:Tir chaperone protein (CesT) family, putative [Leishmania donovani]|uniref:Tir chaperone protein (CesT) family, putative n=1 Tax=Leishmania donovani TaxID=5661 RepID=A0A3S7X487_LEIDO|nr:Tir chaperone protein (CesT) family, putative [Leishmania donovani]
MEEKQAFFVESTDGRKFKMVIRGDLGKLSVAKIRRYLKSYGVPENQLLLAGNRVLEDSMLGEQFGLENEGVLHLQEPTTMRPLAPAAVPPTTHSRAQLQQKPQLSYGPQSARRETQYEPATNDARQMEREIERLQRQVEAAEARNADLEHQLAQVAKPSAAYPPRGGADGARRMSESSDLDGLQVAKESLKILAQKLGVSLQFDKNLTCVVGTDADFSLLLTYDPATERLYIYSSLLTELPDHPPLRMKLYEVLLEGSLLGREVCGGGVGLSTQNNVVVLTTSLPVRHCSPEALCEVMPLFVETLVRWRSLIDELLR